MGTKLLTLADLAERWTCEQSTVLEHVRCDGLKFIPVGKIPKGRSMPGQKTYRFRLSDVEDWESNRAMIWARVEAASSVLVVTSAPAPTTVTGWDGKFRGGIKKRGSKAPQ